MLAPTQIYVQPILALLKTINVHALAHITGGGIPGNLVRVLPEDCHAMIDESSWQWPALFKWLHQTANIERQEMYRTFNCGIGMILAIDEKDKKATLDLLAQHNIAGIEIGKIHSNAQHSSGERVVIA